MQKHLTFPRPPSDKKVKHQYKYSSRTLVWIRCINRTHMEGLMSCHQASFVILLSVYIKVTRFNFTYKNQHKY